jgi:lactoylglutathione lyase
MPADPCWEDPLLRSIRHLDYVVLPCRDLAGTAAFYRDVMGFHVQLESERWIELRVGSVLLALSAPRPADATGPAVQLAFRVPPQDVDACYQELLDHGVEIVQPPRVTDEPQRGLWQHRMLFFRDPEGNLLEIYAEVDLGGSAG